MPQLYPEDERKRQLECLRLASDLVQLASNSLDPYLKANCLRMAQAWSAQAEEARRPTTRLGSFSIH
jgi:hypothetical protein